VVRRGSRRTAAALAIVLGAAMLGGALLGVARPWERAAGCQRTVEHAEWSVARLWDEALLDAIRRDLPAPTVHARNLFHLSTAMWDAWATYDPSAKGYFVAEKHSAADIQAAREEAISYAAHGVLTARYANSIGAVDTITELDGLMGRLCYDLEVSATDTDSPAAVGARIARAVLDRGLTDGSNEAEGYASPGYEPVNPPLVVAGAGTKMTDPNRWQPLQLAKMISQNGIAVENGVQQFIDPHWGHVASFALPQGGADGLPIDPGPPPLLGDPTTDAAYKQSAIDVIRCSSLLDPTDGETIDISPGAYGANSLGTNDGHGRSVNPVTGTPYEPNVVAEGDFTRALTEFFADGPRSETPPGHWNTLANAASDDLAPELRIGGTGEPVDRLQWDVKLYLALNGANHDAAIAAWGVKNRYDSVRPISMIRYMAGLGQSSDPEAPSYDRRGLPLVPGLVEVITRATTASGERHAALKGHEGEIAIHAWSGNPADPEHERAGVTWIRGVEWVPYQKPTFVTPSFAGYVSGHSTFSRASAEVLTAFTGSEFFPGGLGEWTIEADALETEAGPDRDVTLQWATYYDAADQAGVSRLYGGIHIPADDLTGRVMGSRIGKAAWSKAQGYYGGPIQATR
jgi:Domain of unknown function (DUF6851)